jgi:hypothetical protein
MGGMGGGGGKGGSAPSAPDFQKIAQQQAQMSQQAVNQQTMANRANQQNAFGATSNWTQGPNGQWTQTAGAGGGLGQGIQNLLGQVGSQGPLGTGDQARDQAITGAYNQAASRLDPQWQQAQEANKAQLAAQGLDPGSEAYQTQMGNVNRAQNDAYSSAMNNAIGQGTAAQQATFAENLAAQNAPYQQLGQLAGLTGQAGYNAAGQAQTPDMLGAAQQAYQAAQQQYGQQQSGKNSTMSGLGSLAGGVGGMFLGGPLGAGIGSQLGGAAGNVVSGIGTNGSPFG